MRIGLIYHQFVPRGGLEKYLVEFARHLVAAGHELEIATAVVAPEIARQIPAQWHRLRVVQGVSMLQMWHFDRLASHWELEAPVAVSIGFGRTTSQDLHRAGGGCHAVYSRQLPAWKRLGPKNRLELALERRLYTGGRTKLFVVNASQVADQLHGEYGTPKELFRVIHTPVDSERYQPAEDRNSLRAKVCESLGTDAQRPVFLFVSLNHRRKGLDVLLKVWREVDADLWIVGPPLKFGYRLKIAQNRLQGKVRTISPQSDLEMLFQAADWFIHPTLYDACANTVLQSMACGLPGLISVNDGAIDHVRDGENGWLLRAPQDPGAVLQGIQRALAMSPAARQAMGEAARQSMQSLTWDAHLKKWSEAMDEVG